MDGDDRNDVDGSDEPDDTPAAEDPTADPNVTDTGAEADDPAEEAQPRSLIDPAVFAAYGVWPGQEAIARAITPITEELGRKIADSIAPLLPKIELPWPALKFDLPLLPAQAKNLFEGLRQYEPPNWPAEPINIDLLVDIVRHEGLPLVWVPRGEVLLRVLDAKDRQARVAVLLAHCTAVIEDCHDVLTEVISPSYADKAVLVSRALQALDAGHHEAAQALAVVVIESATRAAIDRTSQKVVNKVRIGDPDDVVLRDMRVRLALAPLDKFFSNYEPGKTPRELKPEGLNRHLTVHDATPEHLTQADAVVAVMLAASVLRAFQEVADLEATGVDVPWLRK